MYYLIKFFERNASKKATWQLYTRECWVIPKKIIEMATTLINDPIGTEKNIIFIACVTKYKCRSLLVVSCIFVIEIMKFSDI